MKKLRLKINKYDRIKVLGMLWKGTPLKITDISWETGIDPFDVGDVLLQLINEEVILVTINKEWVDEGNKLIDKLISEGKKKSFIDKILRR